MNRIEPGYRIDNFILGKTESELNTLLAEFTRSEDDWFVIYKNECMDLYFSNKTGKLYEIIVHSNYSGTFENILKIGTTMDAIVRNYGECIIAFDNFYAINKYRDKDLYGLLLEFTDDTINGKIVAIHVYDELYLK